LARRNNGVLKEIAWIRAERKFYNPDDLYDTKDGNKWRLKRRVISEQVAVLIGSFPNAGPHNPQTYAGMLTNEIAATDTNAIVLEAACREVRRTKTFPPTIAEVLEILEKQENEMSGQSEADDLDNWKHWNKEIARKRRTARQDRLAAGRLRYDHSETTEIVGIIRYLPGSGTRCDDPPALTAGTR
jgi:hypothetical protein